VETAGVWGLGNQDLYVPEGKKRTTGAIRVTIQRKKLKAWEGKAGKCGKKKGEKKTIQKKKGTRS